MMDSEKTYAPPGCITLNVAYARLDTRVAWNTFYKLAVARLVPGAKKIVGRLYICEAAYESAFYVSGERSEDWLLEALAKHEEPRRERRRKTTE